MAVGEKLQHDGAVVDEDGGVTFVVVAAATTVEAVLSQEVPAAMAAPLLLISNSNSNPFVPPFSFPLYSQSSLESVSQFEKRGLRFFYFPLPFPAGGKAL